MHPLVKCLSMQQEKIFKTKYKMLNVKYHQECPDKLQPSGSNNKQSGGKLLLWLLVSVFCTDDTSCHNN